MSMNLIALLYLVASVCFIQALKGLSHPTTSIRGNLFGMTGMTIAVLTTIGLIHGACPDALVLCHEPTRTHMRGLPHYPLPDLQVCMDANLAAAHLVNRDCRFVGISINTAKLAEADALRLLKETEAKFGLPTVDPFRTGVGAIADRLW